MAEFINEFKLSRESVFSYGLKQQNKLTNVAQTKGSVILIIVAIVLITARIIKAILFELLVLIVKKLYHMSKVTARTYTHCKNTL